MGNLPVDLYVMGTVATSSPLRFILLIKFNCTTMEGKIEAMT